LIFLGPVFSCKIAEGEVEMLRLIGLILVACRCYAADPAILHVQVRDGKYLTFNIENQYQSPVTKFEVAVTFPGTGLGCGLIAEVKKPEDLRPAGTCGLPVNMGDGRAHESTWKPRIVFVEFADGMRWTPKR
jgi:hypothetical protein